MVRKEDRIPGNTADAGLEGGDPTVTEDAGWGEGGGVEGARLETRLTLDCARWVGGETWKEETAIVVLRALGRGGTILL